MSRPAVRMPHSANEDAVVVEPLADARRFWREAFATVRDETERRAALLAPEDQVVSSRTRSARFTRAMLLRRQ